MQIKCYGTLSALNKTFIYQPTFLSKRRKVHICTPCYLCTCLNLSGLFFTRVETSENARGCFLDFYSNLKYLRTIDVCTCTMYIAHQADQETMFCNIFLHRENSWKKKNGMLICGSVFLINLKAHSKMQSNSRSTD